MCAGASAAGATHWCTQRDPGYDARIPSSTAAARMTTYISDQQARRITDIESRTSVAWAEYSGELRELDGRDYEEAEEESWARLQRKLRQLDDERSLVEGS